MLTEEALKPFEQFESGGGQTNVCRLGEDKITYLEIPQDGARTIGDLHLVELDRDGTVWSMKLKDGVQTRKAEEMLWPVEGEYLLSALHGGRTHPITGEVSGHSGIDIVADEGTKVQAALSGVVTESAFDKQYGNYVLIAHENGKSTLYCHMKECLVEAGDTVSREQIIGIVGKTGAATGAHLHFELRQDGTAVDPIANYPDAKLSLLMDGQEEPVLVEWPVVFN